MGMLDRASDIAKANFNDMLSRAEDPEKMIDQHLIELAETLAEVKREAAGIIAEEARAKRLVADNDGQIARFDGLARMALAAGNEHDARVFLAKKQELQADAVTLGALYGAARENADKMRAMHDKLVDDIEGLNARRATIRAKESVAAVQEKLNEFAGAGKADEAADAFERMDDRADEMLDRANAMRELNEVPVDEAIALERTYSGSGYDTAVENELAGMKKELGL